MIEIHKMNRKQLHELKATTIAEFKTIDVAGVQAEVLRERLREIERNLGKCFWDGISEELCRQCWQCYDHYR
jgi:hypothetical protein